MFYYDKKCIVRRYSSTLGEYNRPVNKLSDVGTYECTVKISQNSTAQLHPQKSNSTGFTLYMDPECVFMIWTNTNRSFYPQNIRR